MNELISSVFPHIEFAKMNGIQGNGHITTIYLEKHRRKVNITQQTECEV